MFPLLLVLAASGTDPFRAPPGYTEAPPTHVPAVSTWDRMFPTGHCAGPALQPFQKHPRVCPVAVCPCEPTTDDAKPNRAWVKEFHSAAHVPYPRFDLDGNPVPGDGLLIYEGMRFSVDPKTGNYDLSFTATVPAMPVVLRLQLTLTSPDRKQEYKLTLPMIRMEPPRDAKPGDPAPRTFHVAHRGYSSLLIEQPAEYQLLAKVPGLVPCPFAAPITCKWEITRNGTARFGTPIAIEDPNR